jgi:hypothetical protein
MRNNNQNSSNQKGNIRTALAVTIALALGGAALASGDSEPKEPKITFESNAQAQARLQDLARVYGDEVKVSASEKRDINSAVEGAIPVFKDTIVEDLTNLSSLLPEGRGRNAKVSEGGTQVTYSIYTYEHEGVKGITIARAPSAGSTTAERLSLDFTPSGPSVSYTRSESSGADGDPSLPGVQARSERYLLSIDGDNSLYTTKTDSADMSRYGRHDYEASFDGHFDGRGLGTGSDVEFVAARMQQAGDMVTGAVAALSNPTQPQESIS